MLRETEGEEPKGSFKGKKYCESDMEGGMHGWMRYEGSLRGERV